MEHPEFVAYLPHHGVTGHERRELGLVVICAAMFISAVDLTIVNVALPDISGDLSARVGELQWVLDGFLVCLAGLLLVGSGLADRFGRKRVFLLGLAGFTVSSVLAGLSGTVDELIGARVLMGAFAACVLPPAISLIAVLYTPDERPRALAIWAAAAGVGLAVGPLLGGALVREFGWQAVFFVNVPVTLTALVLGIGALRESHRPGTPPLDLVGAGLSIAALGTIVFVLIEGVDAGWTNALVIAAATIGVVCSAAFVRVELRSRAPLFDIRALFRRRVLAGVVALLSLYMGTLGGMFVLPQYLQYVRHESVFVSGLTLAPAGAATLIAAPFSARLRTVLGTPLTLAGSLLLDAAGFATLLFLGGGASVALVVVSMVVLGTVIALGAPPATAVIMDDLGEAKAGDGGAINQLSRQVGGALGVAIVGSVFAALYAARVHDALAGFPATGREQASKSIEEAQEVISRVAGAAHTHLLARITHAFDVGAHAGIAVIVAALLAATLAVIVALRQPPASAQR